MSSAVLQKEISGMTVKCDGGQMDRRPNDFRSLKTRIYKFIAGTGRFDYGKVLQDLVASFNNQPHRGLPKRLTPNQVKEHVEEVYKFLYGDRWQRNAKFRFKFELNQKVRVCTRATVFSKRYNLEKWSSKIYRISKRIPSRPPRYKLTNDDNSELLGSFYSQELQPVTTDTVSQTVFKVKKVLRRRVSNGVREMLVQYDSPTRYLEWISETQFNNGSIIP